MAVDEPTLRWPDSSGSVAVQSAVIERPQIVQVKLLREAPQLSPEEFQPIEDILKRTHLPGPRLPKAPVFGAEIQQPAVPPSAPGVVPELEEQQELPHALGDLKFLHNTDLGAGAPPNSTSFIGEPSVANNGRFVFQSGNRYAALSNDDGATFRFVNPRESFPFVNGGFCCDQVVLYDKSRDLLFWSLMYIQDGNANTLRLAIAQGMAALERGAWYYYDFTPQHLGLPDGRWFDYPQLTLSDNFLYITANVFSTDPPCPPACQWTTSIIMRLPLDALRGRTRLPMDFLAVDDHFTLTPTQGATSTLYWGSHDLQSYSIRIYQWAETSTTALWDDVGISAYPSASSYMCPGPDGRDWCGRADDRMITGWVANGVIGFMWNASQGDGFPYPHVRVVRFSERTRGLLNEPTMWSSRFAWLYPTVGVNARGHIAGPIFWGGGLYYPSAAVFIWDDLSNTPPPWDTYFVVASTHGPAQNRWGDFLAARPHFPNSRTWIGTAYALQGGGDNANARPRFLWFGRARDLPALLTISKTGTGSGRVTSNPPGIDCGSDCSEPYTTNTRVTLTATPAAGSIFAGWRGGGCPETGPCTLTLTADIAVTATFNIQQFTLALSVEGAGSGTVASSPPGIVCGAGAYCAGAYPPGTVMTLTAAPAAGSIFAGWSGGVCAGTNPCTVTLTADAAVIATFHVLQTLGEEGTGRGADTGPVFTSWSVDVDCLEGMVTPSINKTCTAIFHLASLPACMIQMSQASYVDGETVAAQALRLANPGATPAPIEIGIWVDVPGVPPIPVVNLGAKGAVVLPVGFIRDFGPLPLFRVAARVPRGTYGFSCRLVDPVTGQLVSEDLNPFEIR
ncbi:MAG: hypothetical protein HYZ81_23695 [Nitrospinae bacterium]|nr:hypothetical protein [Nitrospinota bacterium]